jgi:hypothetical protein
MDEKNPRWVVFYEWTTDEHETRIRSGVAQPVVVQRSWTFRETFPHDDKNAAILCYRKALRGEWVAEFQRKMAERGEEVKPWTR